MNKLITHPVATRPTPPPRTREPTGLGRAYMDVLAGIGVYLGFEGAGHDLVVELTFLAETLVVATEAIGALV